MARIVVAASGQSTAPARTFADWLVIYDEILTTRPFGPKTLENRRNSLRHLKNELGAQTIADIKPHQVAQLVRRIHAVHPSTARRILIEARDCFGEALVYGWIDSNPAAAVRHMPARIQRKRLSLEDWKAIHTYAEQNLPPWVPRMMVLALVTGQRRGDLVKMRFADAHDGYLHIVQQKTGTKLRLPLALRLDAIDTSIGEAIEACRGYASGDEFLLRKSTGKPLTLCSLSARFEVAREGALGIYTGEGAPASLHECRSLSERLYRPKGIPTKDLLGHRHQQMTDVYNDDRGLTAGNWTTLEI